MSGRLLCILGQSLPLGFCSAVLVLSGCEAFPWLGEHNGVLTDRLTSEAPTKASS